MQKYEEIRRKKQKCEELPSFTQRCAIFRRSAKQFSVLRRSAMLYQDVSHVVTLHFNDIEKTICYTLFLHMVFSAMEHALNTLHLLV